MAQAARNFAYERLRKPAADHQPVKPASSNTKPSEDDLLTALQQENFSLPTDAADNYYDRLDALTELKIRYKKARREVLEVYINYWRKKRNELAKTNQIPDDLKKALEDEFSNLNNSQAKNILNKINNFYFDDKVASELKTRKGIIIAGFIFSIITGFGFFSMTFTHVIVCIKNLAFLSGAAHLGVLTKLMVGAAAAISSVSWLPWLIAGFFSVFAGVAWGMLMYRTFTRVVKNFKEPSWQQFYKLLNKLGITTDKWHNMSTLERAAHVLANILKVAFMLAFVMAVIISALLTAGAYLDATIDFFVMLFGHVGNAIHIVMNVVIFVFMTPVDTLFSVRHSLGALGKFFRSVRDTADRICDAKWWQRIGNKPLASIVYVGVCLVCLMMLVFHAAADAAFTVGNGAHSSENWTGQTFRSVMEKLKLMPEKVAVAVSTAIETLEHGDFVSDCASSFIAFVKGLIYPSETDAQVEQPSNTPQAKGRLSDIKSPNSKMEYVDKQFVEQYQQHIQSNKRWNNVGRIFVFFTVTAVTFLGTVSLWILFPAIPTWVLAMMTLTGIAIELMTFTQSVPDAFSMIAARGLLNDVENHVLVRHISGDDAGIKTIKTEINTWQVGQSAPDGYRQLVDLDDGEGGQDSNGNNSMQPSC